MFGATYFGQLAFASVLAVATPPPPVAAPATGYPFAEDLRVPPARLIPHFDHVRMLERDEEDLLQLSALWLTRK